MKNCRYENKNGTCGLKGSHAYRHKCYTTDSCKCWEPPTNADRIRAMNDEELAKWMALLKGDTVGGSAKFILEWLQQPAKEEHHEAD